MAKRHDQPGPTRAKGLTPTAPGSGLVFQHFAAWPICTMLKFKT
jgi:hypothetical protein